MPCSGELCNGCVNASVAVTKWITRAKPRRRSYRSAVTGSRTGASRLQWRSYRPPVPSKDDGTVRVSPGIVNGVESAKGSMVVVLVSRQRRYLCGLFPPGRRGLSDSRQIPLPPSPERSPGSIRQLRETRLAPRIDIVEHRKERHQRLHHVLPVRADVHQGHAVVYHAHDEASHDRADDRSDPA